MVLVAVAVLLALWLLYQAVRFTGRRAFALDGKVVVITGAASGIGRRLAQKVFNEARDVTLALLDIDTKALKTLQKELLQTGGGKQVFVYECNVADHG
ncbi:hypothetical protein V7S43_014638 [Phytophthora oleae]|uniref:Uncharacterized protein n=1 Tax=Phytophthora oleae TaxID=2107226 RepID=A0ABD3F2K5_9STRA